MIAIVAIASLAMSACNKSESHVVIADVLNDAAKVCNFIPTSETIVVLLSAAPGLDTALKVAQVLCDALHTYEANNQTPAGVQARNNFDFNMVINGKHVHVTGTRAHSF
jgi:hypothetical protein